jgi:hypothetical protein
VCLCVLLIAIFMSHPIPHTTLSAQLSLCSVCVYLFILLICAAVWCSQCVIVIYDYTFTTTLLFLFYFLFFIIFVKNIIKLI